MRRSIRIFSWLIFLAVLLTICLPAAAQKKSKKSKKSSPKGTPVMWQQVDISRRDLFLGPGGEKMQPDLSRITLIARDKSGTSLKYRIKDGAGHVWVAKIDREAQSETASVRLVWALGYKSEINYLAPTLTIPGKGTFSNVRLEARPEDVKRLGPWNWKGNPFTGTKEFQGLKIILAMLNDWDLKDSNNVILQQDNELQYAISDLGATFGKYGNNRLPIFYRIGRSKNNPADYSRSKFINRVNKGYLKFAFNGKNTWLFKNITVEQGRWLADLLLQLSDGQIEDAFRAANYSPADIKTLAGTFKKRINELDQLTGQKNLAGTYNLLNVEN